MLACEARDQRGSEPFLKQRHVNIEECDDGFTILEVLCGFVILSLCSLIIVRNTETGISQLRNAKLYPQLAEQILQNDLDMASAAPIRSARLVSSNSEWLVLPSPPVDGKITQKTILVRPKAER